MIRVLSVVMRRFLPALILFYPVAVFFGLDIVAPRYFGLLLLLILLVRWRGVAGGVLRPRYLGVGVFLLPLLLSAWVILDNSEVSLRLYPALISFSMLFVFGVSLFFPPSMVECFARLQQQVLSPAGVRYTRRVTQVWCVFFVVNGGIAVWSAVYASREVWVLYNGLMAYVLMGILFLGERLLRHRWCGSLTQ